MTATRLKHGLLLSVALGAISLVVAATGKSDAPSKPSAQNARRPKAAAAPAAAPAELEEVTVVITHSFLSNRTRETVRVSANGTCLDGQADACPVLFPCVSVSLARLPLRGRR